MSFTFAIGDIHGCHTQLEQLLTAIEFTCAGGTIVFLGDYIDRGPANRAVVERIVAGPTEPDWTWITLMGNHEELMVSALRHGKHVSAWLENGGAETFDSFGGQVPETVLDWMERLPLIHIDQHRIFVHAGVDEAYPLEAQTRRTLLWSRPMDGISGHYWGRHVCHGHTPRPGNPLTSGNRTNIDSGCVFGGSLTAAMFDDGQPGGPVRFISIDNGDEAWGSTP